MLIKCPECELQLSDKAVACPHCGYPMRTNTATKRPKKHMRLPNGFGQISLIKNRNLRNPYRAMVTIGKTETGKPISKMLKPNAYFHTYNEAYEALVEYHRNPYDLEADITVNDLYERWSSEYFKTLKSDSSVRTITSAWNYCENIKQMRVADVRARHIKGVIDDGKYQGHTASAGVKSRIKSLFNLMLDYAVEYELTDKNYSRTFNLDDAVINEKERSKRAHIPFTDDEMDKLWNALENIKWIDMILIQCYTGFRPKELCELRIENINDGFIKGGMKTEAGTDRLVPIHSAIEPLISAKIKEAANIKSPMLFNSEDGSRMTYDKYKTRFDSIIKRLGLNPEHRAHDPRVHFVTCAKKYHCDEYAIKYIVGHRISDITEKVYTQRELDWLKEEIEKIK